MYGKSDKMRRAFLLGLMLRLGTGLFVAGAALLLYFFDPSDGANSAVFPPCPTNEITGLHCFGCGSLRALHALLHGRLGEAVSQNVFAVIFAPILPIMLLFPKPFQKPCVPIALLMAIVLFMVLRNLPYFDFLAPH